MHDRRIMLSGVNAFVTSDWRKVPRSGCRAAALLAASWAAPLYRRRTLQPPAVQDQTVRQSERSTEMEMDREIERRGGGGGGGRGGTHRG